MPKTSRAKRKRRKAPQGIKVPQFLLPTPTWDSLPEAWKADAIADDNLLKRMTPWETSVRERVKAGETLTAESAASYAAMALAVDMIRYHYDTVKQAHLAPLDCSYVVITVRTEDWTSKATVAESLQAAQDLVRDLTQFSLALKVVLNPFPKELLIATIELPSGQLVDVMDRF
jgi:hypothetical protein